MKKILLLGLVINLFTIIKTFSVPEDFYIYFGSVSKDNSGFEVFGNGITWGECCDSGRGICFSNNFVSNTGGEKEKIEIYKNLSVTIKLDNIENINEINKWIKNNQVELLVNSPVPSTIISKFTFLDQKAKYIIPKGNYYVKKENNSYTITLKISKI